MSDADRILSEFMHAWEAGQAPDPDEYLDRAPPGEQHELSQQIRTYLAIAPEPAYSEAAWARLCDDPAALRAGAMALGEPEGWPSLLPRLRARAGLSLREVAERLGVSRPEKAERYLRDMEAGTHDPRRVTRRALEALGRVLGVSAETLAWTGGGGGPSPALLRSASPEGVQPVDYSVEELAELGTTSAEDWDDSDDLFCGGRDAA
jgi:transcriptional regulator with XRE-family HTH domain